MEKKILKISLLKISYNSHIKCENYMLLKQNVFLTCVETHINLIYICVSKKILSIK